MDPLIQIFSIGVVTAILSTVLKEAGKADQAKLLDLASSVIVLFIIIGLLRSIFVAAQGFLHF